MRLRWLSRAEVDLSQIIEFLVERDRRGAGQINNAILRQVARLEEQPRLGRSGRIAGTRELVIARTPYIAVYQADERSGEIIVLRIFHGSQEWPDRL